MWETKKYEIQIIQGQTFNEALLFEEGDSPGVPLDISVYTGALSIKDESNNKLGEIHIDMTEATSGRIEMKLSDVETMALPVGTLYYDLALKHSVTGEVEKPIMGRVYVYKGITEPTDFSGGGI